MINAASTESTHSSGLLVHLGRQMEPPPMPSLGLHLLCRSHSSWLFALSSRPRGWTSRIFLGGSGLVFHLLARPPFMCLRKEGGNPRMTSGWMASKIMLH